MSLVSKMIQKLILMMMIEVEVRLLNITYSFKFGSIFICKLGIKCRVLGVCTVGIIRYAGHGGACL